MFPQASSIQPVLDGQQFWRLNTLVASPGDMYESQVGSLAFAVGPNSDIANYNVNYYDGENDTLISSILVTPDRDTIGRIDARNDAQYKGGGTRKGRILISLADIYDPTIKPSTFSAGNDTIEYEIPVIDFLQYFSNPPSLTPQRSDREFQYQYFRPPAVATHSTYEMIPAYGRKSGVFVLQNNDLGNIVTVSVLGLRLATTNGAVEHALFAPQALAGGASFQYPYKSSSDGLFDMFAIRLANYHSGAMPVTVVLSDDAL